MECAYYFVDGTWNVPTTKVDGTWKVPTTFSFVSCVLGSIEGSQCLGRLRNRSHLLSI
jgi:hypothetical protein